MAKEHGKKLETVTGYSKNNLPYFRMGSGQRIIVIFGGGIGFLGIRVSNRLLFRQTLSVYRL